MHNSLKHLERFIEALIQEPSQAEFMGVLVRDHLTDQHVRGIELLQLEETHELNSIFSYGKQEHDPYPRSVAELSEVFGVDDVIKKLETHGSLYNPTHRITVCSVSLRSGIRGFYLYKHENHYENRVEDSEFIRILSKLMNMYCSISAPTGSETSPHKKIIIDAHPNLSARQLVILGGMLSGKTNDELSEQIGYSSSTIRHEAMAIYKTLGVSNRADAARTAKELGLI